MWFLRNFVIWLMSEREQELTLETQGPRTASQILVDGLQTEFGALLTRIDPLLRRTRFGTTPEHDGSAHVEVSDDGSFHYIATERGKEVFHETTQDKGRLLYWLVKEVARSMALDYEVHHRVRGRDFRRLYFAKEVELMALVNPTWAEWCQDEIDETLARYPFDDRLCGSM